MSVGSPKLVCRVPAALLAEIDQQISKRNLHSQNQPWNRTDFVLAAIREKLAHMRRARTQRTAKDKAKARGV